MTELTRDEYEQTVNRPYDERVDGPMAFKGVEEEPAEPTWGETLDANMYINNTAGTYVYNLTEMPEPLNESDGKDFNPVEYMPEGVEGTDREASFLSTAVSPRHAEYWTRLWEKEKKDRTTIEQAGMVKNLGTGALAGLSDPVMLPTMLLPAAAVLARTTKMGTLAATVTEAGVTAVTVGASEKMLHGMQQERTVEESVFNIGASVLFTSALTGLGMSARGIRDTTRRLDTDMAEFDARPAITEIEPEYRHASAAETLEDLPAPLEKRVQDKYKKEVDEGRMTRKDAEAAIRQERAALVPKMSQVKHPALYRALGYISPSVRVATSQGHQARVLGAQLLDNPLQQMRNQHGDSLGNSVEVMSDFLTNRTATQVKDTVNTVFKKAKRDGDIVSRTEFNSEISKALRNGDRHDNPFVQDAARALRQNVMDPMEKRMLDMGMLKKDYDGYENVTPDDLDGLIEGDKIARLFNEDGTTNVDRMAKLPRAEKEVLEAQGKLVPKAALPTGDESYLHRVYDFSKIDNNAVEFEQALVTIFREKGVESIDGDIKARQEKLFDLEAQYKVDAEAFEAKKSDFPAEKKAAISEKQKELSNLQRSLTQTNNQLLRMARDRDAVNWREYEEILVRADEKQLNLKEARRDMRNIKGSKASARDQIEQAKWDLKLASEGREAQVAVLDSQLKTAARDVRKAIMSDEYNTGTPIKIFRAGPLKERVVNIPSNRIENWLVNDIDDVMSKYMLDTSPRLALREKFDFVGGDVEVHIQDKINSALDEYDDLIEKTAAPKEKRKLRSEQKKVKRDLSAQFEMLMNRYKMPDNPNGAGAYAAQELKKFQFTTKLGMMTISAIPDVGHVIMRQGMLPMAKHLGRMAGLSKAFKGQRELAKSWGIHVDLATNERARRMFMGDTIIPLTKPDRFQNFTDKSVDLFGKATGMPYWNAEMKMMVSSIYSDELVKASLKSGNLKSGDLARYAKAGLSHDDLKGVAREFNNQAGDKIIDGAHLPNTKAWEDQALASRFELAVFRETEQSIVTPGKGDLPLISKGLIGQLILQFKSFAMSANNRVLLATIDDFSAQKVFGAMSMVGLGTLSYMLREVAKGREPKMDADTLIKEGIDRSGLLAFWSDPNMLVEKMTRGQVSAYKALGLDGEPLSRMASRNIVGAVAGVNAGLIQDVGQVVGALTNGEWTESDARAVRRGIYLNNLHITHQAFTELEKAIGGRQ